MRFFRPLGPRVSGRNIVTLLAVLLALSAVTVLFTSGCGGSGNAGAATTAAGTSTLQTRNGRLVRQGPVTQDDIKQIVNEVVGQNGEMGEPIIRKITLTPTAGGTAVTMDLTRTDCPMIGMHMVCSADQLPSVAATMSSGIMSIVFEYADVAQVQINLYADLTTMIDMTSNSGMKDVLVATTMFSRAAADKTDWSAYSASNAPKTATSYWLNPAVPLTGLSTLMGAPPASASSPSSGATTPANPPAAGGSGGSMPGM